MLKRIGLARRSLGSPPSVGYGNLFFAMLIANSAQLQEQGLSGRALRRLPVLALARYIGAGVSASTIPASPVPNGLSSKGAFRSDINMWLNAMEKVVKDRFTEHAKLA